MSCFSHQHAAPVPTPPCFRVITPSPRQANSITEAAIEDLMAVEEMDLIQWSHYREENVHRNSTPIPTLINDSIDSPTAAFLWNMTSDPELEFITGTSFTDPLCEIQLSYPGTGIGPIQHINSQIAMASPIQFAIKALETMEKFVFMLPKSILQQLGRPIGWLDIPHRILYAHSTTTVISTYRPNTQTLYFAIHALANKLVRFERLMDPKDDTDKFFVDVICFLNCLGISRLISMLDTFPVLFRNALAEGLFQAAAETGAHHVIEAVLTQGVDPNIPWATRNSPQHALMRAAHHRHKEVVTVLLRYNTFLRPHYFDDASLFEYLVLCGLNITPQVLYTRFHRIQNPNVLSACVKVILSSQDCFKKHIVLLSQYIQFCNAQEVNCLLLSIPKTWVTKIKDRSQTKHKLKLLLKSAILSHNIKGLRVLLELGLEPDKEILSYTIAYINMPAFNLLLSFFSNFPDPIGYGLIELAIRHENDEAIEMFKQRGYFHGLQYHAYNFQECILAALDVGNENLLVDLLDLWRCARPMSFDFDYIRSFKPKRIWEFYLARHSYRKLLHEVIESGMINTRLLLKPALEIGELELIEMCLKNVRCFREDSTDLHAAVLSGKLKIIKALMSVGAPTYTLLEVDHETAQKAGWPAGNYFLMAIAILCGDQEIIDFLFDSNVPVDSSDPEFRPYKITYFNSRRHLPNLISPLHATVHKRDYHLTERLFERDADICDLAAIRHACFLEDTGIISQFLNASKLLPRGRQKDFYTLAIGAAIEVGNMAVFRLMLDHVDPNHVIYTEIRSNIYKHDNALTRAIQTNSSHSLEMMGSLLRRDANPNMLVQTRQKLLREDSYLDKSSILKIAVATGNLRKVQVLVDAGAKVDIPTVGAIRQTPLQAAVEIGAINIVEYLLQKNANPNEPPGYYRGRTALQLSAAKGCIGIASMLIEKGAAVNEPRCKFEGRTAFEAAAEEGRIEMLYFLVENGADLVSDGGQQRRNASWLAKNNGHHAVADAVDFLYNRECQKAGQSALGFLDAPIGQDA